MAKIIKKDAGGKSTEAKNASRVIKRPVGATTGGVIKAKPTGTRKVIKAAAEQEAETPETEVVTDALASPAPDDSHSGDAVTGSSEAEPSDADPFDEPRDNKAREGSSLHRNPLIARPEDSTGTAKATRARRSGPKPSEVATAIVNRAQQDARKLAELVEREIQDSLKDARARGRREGHAQSGDLSQRVEHLAEGLLKEVESQAVETALVIARQLIAAELKVHPEAIVEVVRQALASSRQQREVNIRVNPVHAQTLKDNKRELVDVLGRAKDVDVREDADLAPGGCMVETEIGTIDARLDTQFEALTRQLTGGH